MTELELVKPVSLAPLAVEEPAQAEAQEPVQEIVTPRGNAQMETKIYFWYNPRTQHIMQGAPPQYDAMKPMGYQTIECNHAHEAEKWSERLRTQDQRITEMSDYEREQIEGPMREDLRKQIKARLRELESGTDTKNARLNAAFMKHALRMLDQQEEKAKTIRQSYLHVEAFEHGR
jgi:TolA-binding protein